jgi:hypothetical protein
MATPPRANLSREEPDAGILHGSPSSHVTPNVSTTACPSDISIRDRGDISIGDRQIM